jgi:hypothetical protein
MTTIAGLSRALAEVREHEGLPDVLIGNPDGTYCPSCGGIRRMSLVPLFRVKRPTVVSSGPRVLRHDLSNPENLPAAFQLSCVQCSAVIIVVAYSGPDGPEVAALPSTYGGLATPNTPPSVSYYLDQAERASSVAAHSAAMTMYRSALEQILTSQGYTDRMLGPKLGAIRNDPEPPRWYQDLDPEFLSVIGKLGNAATHDDVAQQAAIDRELLGEVRALFVELLDDIYEQPARRAARLDKLRAASSTSAKPPA